MNGIIHGTVLVIIIHVIGIFVNDTYNIARVLWYGADGIYHHMIRDACKA